MCSFPWALSVHPSGCNQDFTYFPQISQYISTLFPNTESCMERKWKEPLAVDHSRLFWPIPSLVYEYSDHSARLCIAISPDIPGHKPGLLTGFMSLSGSLRTWEHITLSNYSGMNEVCATPETSESHKARTIFTFEICAPCNDFKRPPLLSLVEPTCATAQWAHKYCFLSVPCDWTRN